MDPIHFTAARNIRTHDTRPADEIDAFYDHNSLEGLHALRQAGAGIARFVRSVAGRLRSRDAAAPKFARTPRSA